MLTHTVRWGQSSGLETAGPWARGRPTAPRHSGPGRHVRRAPRSDPSGLATKDPRFPMSRKILCVSVHFSELMSESWVSQAADDAGRAGTRASGARSREGNDRRGAGRAGVADGPRRWVGWVRHCLSLTFRRLSPAVHRIFTVLSLHLGVRSPCATWPTARTSRWRTRRLRTAVCSSSRPVASWPSARQLLGAAGKPIHPTRRRRRMRRRRRRCRRLGAG